MTEEELSTRLRTVLDHVENLHQDVQEDPEVVGPIPDDIGPDAQNCAEWLARLRASFDCLTRDIDSRHLAIRGARRRLQ